MFSSFYMRESRLHLMVEEPYYVEAVGFWCLFTSKSRSLRRAGHYDVGYGTDESQAVNCQIGR